MRARGGAAALAGDASTTPLERAVTTSTYASLWYPPPPERGVSVCHSREERDQHRGKEGGNTTATRSLRHPLDKGARAASSAGTGTVDSVEQTSLFEVAAFCGHFFTTVGAFVGFTKTPAKS